jgi:hypothetical protein
MTWYSEPTGDELEAGRAAVFLAETKRALRGERVPEITLRLQVQSTIHNQREYRVHATSGEQPVTPPEGHHVHPITGTPLATARMLAAYARHAVKKQLPLSSATTAGDLGSLDQTDSQK